MTDPTDLETLASYLPPLIVRRLARATGQADPDQANVEGLYAAVLFGDISGFTALTEQYAQRGATGIEDISRLLNDYFTPLIGLVSAHGGEVVKFAGDALLAFWPVTEPVEINIATQQAAACALAMQHALRDYTTPEGQRLALRITLSAGSIASLLLGGLYGRWETLFAGMPLGEAGLAQKQALPGQVVASASAWQRLSGLASSTPLAEGCTRIEQLYNPIATQTGVSSPLAEYNAAVARWEETQRLTLEARLRAYVPGAIRSRLAAGQTSWLAELRRVSVLFINLPDLHHDTPLQQAQAAMLALQSVIYHYEGSINKLSVDEKGVTLVAALGLPPLAHEDDAARSARAALAVQVALQKLGMRCAIGITSGKAFCGVIGSPTRREYTLIGAVVNLAARLMTTAGEGILCDAATAHAAGEQVEFESLAPVQVKGRSEPVEIFRPLNKRRLAAVGQERQPMVGRQNEREQLGLLLLRLQMGQNGVAIIQGDAGIGKSRLVADLLEQALLEGGVQVMQGAGDAIDKSAPYHAWRPVFSQLLRMEDAPEALAERQAYIQTALAALVPHIGDLDERLALLNNVLSGDFPESALTRQLAGPVRADNSRDLLLALLAACTARQPLLLAMEDAHWLDSASWQLALAAARQVRPLLLVISTRPLGKPAPGEYTQLAQDENIAHIHLETLSHELIMQLVCQRLGVPALPHAAAELIRQKAEGHPFFSEELAYALRDAGLIVVRDGQCVIPDGVDLEQAAFPDTIQGVITSRIDRLAAQEQLALKVASVIGRVFAFQALRDIHPIEADRPHLLQMMKALEQLDLTPLETPEPELAYIFKHVITQEVAYNLMLFAQRQQLHASVATWYERTYSADLSPFYATLAYHWTRAEEVEQATHYLEKAGEQALLDGAYLEAIAFFTQAMRLVGEAGQAPASGGVIGFGQQPASPAALRQAGWLRALAEAHYGLGQLAESQGYVRQALAQLGYPTPATPAAAIASVLVQAGRQAIHRLRPDQSITGPLAHTRLEAARDYALLGEITYFTAQPILGLAAAVTSLNLVEPLGPTPELAKGYANMIIASNMVAQHGLARFYRTQAQKTLEHIEQLSVIAHAMHLSGVYDIGVANWQGAENNLGQAFQVANRLSDRRMAINCETTSAILAHYRGEFEQAAALNANAYQAALRTGNKVQQGWGLYSEAENQNRLGNFSRAIDLLALTAPLLADDTRPAARLRIYSARAVAHWRAGDVQSAWEAIQLAHEINTKTPPTIYSGLEAYSGLAEVFLEMWEQQPADLPTEQLPHLARTAVRILSGYARRYPAGRGRLLALQGLMEWQDEMHERAMHTWERAIQTGQALGMPYDSALAAYHWGRHLTAGSRWRNDKLAAAIEIFERLHAAYDWQRSRSARERRI